MYPLEKYMYIVHRDRVTGELTGKITAVSSYAGKSVRGVARCAPDDKFDEELGKKLAALRCAQKIAEKRVERAIRKVDEAYEAFSHAKHFVNNMEEYYDNAQSEYEEICSQLYSIEESLYTEG